jgi:hypothetical protein
MISIREEYWRSRARELRATAKTVVTADARRAMVEVAERYERLAEQAAAQSRSRTIKLETPTRHGGPPWQR